MAGGTAKRCAKSKKRSDSAEQRSGGSNIDPVEMGPGEMHEFQVCHCPLN